MRTLTCLLVPLSLCAALCGCTQATPTAAAQTSATSGPRETIAVIGTGSVGGALGKRFGELGHTVIYGSRDPNASKVAELVAATGANASAAAQAEAAAKAEIIFLAVPWEVAEPVVKSLGNLSGKILIDPTTPMNEDRQLIIGHTTSAAEQIASWAPGAHVIKAFNATGYGNMIDPRYPEGALTMFIAGDDKDAKARVAKLAAELGFEPLDSGPLTNARHLEPMAMMWIYLASAGGQGTDFGFKVLKR